MTTAEQFDSDQTAASAFRVLREGDDYIMQWQIQEGTIMTVTSIKISADGMRHTIDSLISLRGELYDHD